MLESSVKEQLTSYLSTTVTATSTTNIEPGLSIVLGANSTYDLHAILLTQANGDGMRYTLQFDGTTTINGLIYSEFVTPVPAEVFSLNSAYTNVAADEKVEIRGVLRTSLGGRMYLLFRKNTDVTDDTPILAGSCLIARRL